MTSLAATSDDAHPIRAVAVDARERLATAFAALTAQEKN
jgi:hypothetical protein